MLKINNYIKAESLQQVYDLKQKRGNMIIAGMMWTKMENINVNNAIDISSLGLDKIEETEDSFKIGAMVTLRDLETNEALNKYTDGAIAESVKSIVGVQFRNMATVGGSIFGRFGFSDVYTMLLALDAKVEMFKAGIIELKDFENADIYKDVLVNIIIDKKELKVKYDSLRNSRTDFAVVNCAVAVSDGKYYYSVGARPAVAKLVVDETDALTLTDQQLKDLAKKIAASYHYGDNNRGSATYREKMAAVLIERCLKEIRGGK